MGCAPLTSSIEAYKVELQQAGFKIIEAKDVTEDWRAITAERAVNFARDEKAQVAVIGTIMERGERGGVLMKVGVAGRRKL